MKDIKMIYIYISLLFVTTIIWRKDYCKLQGQENHFTIKVLIVK